MKTISYRQYYYGGDYSNEKLELPDLGGIYEVYTTISHRVKDQEGEVWSKSYIITSPEKFKDSRLIGNIFFGHLSDVFITESDLSVSDIETAPKFTDVYFLDYYKDHKAEVEYFELVKKFKIDADKIITHTYNEEEFKQLLDLKEKINGISSVFKLRRFTPKGLEYSYVGFKDIFGKDITDMNINTVEYNKTFFIEFKTDSDTANMFKEKSEELYNKIINNE